MRAFMVNEGLAGAAAIWKVKLAYGCSSAASEISKRPASYWKKPGALDAVAVMIEGKLQRKVLSLTQQWPPLPTESRLPDFMQL